MAQARVSGTSNMWHVFQNEAPEKVAIQIAMKLEVDYRARCRLPSSSVLGIRSSKPVNRHLYTLSSPCFLWLIYLSTHISDICLDGPSKLPVMSRSKRRFRPKTREELQNEMIRLEKKHRQALDKLKAAGRVCVPVGVEMTRRQRADVMAGRVEIHTQSYDSRFSR